MKFELIVSSPKPGEFKSTGLAVHGEGRQMVILGNGSVVESLGDLRFEQEREVDPDGQPFTITLAYRKVRTASGFEGEVYWMKFDGTDGFKEVA